MRTRTQGFTAVLVALLVSVAAGCGDGNGNDNAASAMPTAAPTPSGDGLLDPSICEPDAGPFSTTIDHPFFSLPVGMKWLLQGEDEEGASVRVEITSLDETEIVAGVPTRVVEERESEDGELTEVSRNFFVRASDGTVCYFGEDVDNFEDGELVSNDGAWRAGENGALPGILMPANPQVGQQFQQERAPGVAEDEAEIVATGARVEVPFGTFTDTIRVEESNPLDGDVSEKAYARGAGLLIDDEFERVASFDVPFSDARIIIEQNATDGDAGIQIFVDGEGYDEFRVVDPTGQTVFAVEADGGVGDIGVTELFFESAEPSFDDLSLADLLALFPEGEYRFTGVTVEGDDLVGSAVLTHALPDGPVLVAPGEDGVEDPANTVVMWNPVADPPGSTIVEYQVVVEREDPLRVFSVHVPVAVTSVTVPPEFLEPGTEYKFEVLAIETSGNQTISERDFETGGAAATTADEIGLQLPFSDARIIIEQNATDGDAGIQIFVDGEGYDEFAVVDPIGQTIFAVEANGGVGDIGVTELFFESAEPSFADLPLADLLALFPEGEYRFTGVTVERDDLVGTAVLTHALPDGPVLVAPEEDGVEDPANTVVMWNPVADPPGSTIVEYQVVVEREDPLRVFSVHVPATVTSVTVPPEFLEPGTEYKFEVLAIEASGNQTISERPFETAG